MQFEPARPFDDLPGQCSHGIYDLQNSALPRALKQIAKKLPPVSVEDIISTFLTRKGLSVGMLLAAEAELTEVPYKDWVDRANAALGGGFTLRFAKDISEVGWPLRTSDRLVLECVLEACHREREHATVNASDYRSVGVLLSSMGFWELALPDWAAINDLASTTPLIEVLRGVIAALGLDQARLSDEANSLLDRLSQQPSEPVLYRIPDIQRGHDWNKVSGTQLDLNCLATALQADSRFIAANAAHLFEAYSGASSRQELLRGILYNGTGWTLSLVGALADAVWGDRAFQALHGRLANQISPGCGYLYKPMMRAEKDSEQVELGVLTTVQGMGCEDPEIAESAAEALRTVDAQALLPHRERMKELLDHWARRGSWCKRCRRPVHGGYCEICRMVPPEPRKHLVHLLFKAGALSFHELLELTCEKGYGVAEEARKALVQWAFSDSDIMRNTVAEIDKGSSSGELLKEFLNQPVDQLRRISDQLLTLLHSTSPAVRARIIGSFSSEWIAPDVARALAQKMLRDDAPEVRLAAARVLRFQSQI